MCEVILSAVGAVAVVAQLPQALGANRLIAVELSSNKEIYLRGEPVDLHVIVRNISDHRVVSTPVYVRNVSPQIAVHMSRDGKKYTEYRIGLYSTVQRIPAFMDVLAPDEERGYPLRVLYTYESPSRLALEKPGTYFLKVRYRVQISKPSPQVAELESNTINIEVRQPTGVDAKVWEALNTKQFIQFLHSGQIAPGFPEILDKSIDIVGRFPRTTYAHSLRNALREYYRSRAKSYRWKSTPQSQQLRELLEIDDRLFPDDKRLDVEITYNFPDPTLLHEFLAELTSACGVPLLLAPEARARRFRAFSETHSLRDFMKGQSTFGFVWVRHEDGYQLTTEDKAYAFRLREAEAERAAARCKQ